MSGKVAFLGMGGAITTAAFWALYKHNVNIVGLVKPYPFYEKDPPTKTRHHRGHWWKKVMHEEPFLDAHSMRQVIPPLGIDMLETVNANHPHVIGWLKRRKPDVICVASYPHIFKKDLLAVAKKGFINFHPSPLPYYRGPNPLFWMFKQGAKEAGATIHFLDRGIDTGAIIHQVKLPIEDGMRGRDLNKQLAEHGAPLFLQAVLETLNDTVQSHPQIKAEGSYQTRASDDDCKLDPSEPAQTLYNFVRGVSQWMPLTYELEEHKFVVIDAISVHKGEHIPGEFLFFDNVLTLQCPDGIVKLKANTAYPTI